MAGYYFIKSNGHLFRLTKKAYRAWLADSASRVTDKKKPAKIRNYGADLGEISDLKSEKDFGFEDFLQLYTAFSPIETEFPDLTLGRMNGTIATE